MKNIIAIVSIISLVFGYFLYNSLTKKVLGTVNDELIKSVLNSSNNDYYSFIKANNSVINTQSIEIKDIKSLILENNDYTKYVESSDNNYIDISQDSYLSIPVNAMDGLYSIKLKYLSIPKNSQDINISVSINSKIQFAQASNLSLEKQYIIEKKTGNLELPVLGESKTAIWSDLVDKSGYITETVYFKLKSGLNTITILTKDSNLKLTEVKLTPYAEVLPYKMVLSNYQDNLKLEPGIIVEAEYPKMRSDQSISEQKDQISAGTTPTYEKETLYNTIGGTKWAMPNQKITWKFSVNKTGLYPIKMRYRQDFTGGSSSKRSLKIDEKVPFLECNDIDFPLSNDWEIKTIGDDTPYYFYLNKGEHTISMSVTLGNNTQPLDYTRTALFNLNFVYRKILQITTSSPDKYRDYSLDEKIPSDLDKLKQQGIALEQLAIWFKTLSKTSADDTKPIDSLVSQIKGFINRPDTIAAKLSDFNSNISALGSWINSRNQMPLEIDSIEIGSNNKTLLAKPSILKQIIFNYKNLKNTFFEKPASVDTNQIKVWITSGKDEESILNKLINQSYPNVNKPAIKLVLPGTQMSAVVAGVGPDVSLMNPNSDAINYATRNSVIELSKFNDFEQVKNRFYDSAVVPFKLNNKYYALPEQQIFPVMFYRKDILDELSITPPDTIKEMIGVIKKLQKKNMQFGFPAGYQGLSMFLYQNGGEFYLNDGMESGLKTQIAAKAFWDWTKIYSDYNVPLSYDLVNRFRTGEMPIAIANYNMFNSIRAFAPELNGLWDISPIPGTLKQDGTVDRSIVASGTCAYILKSTSNENASWEFLKWWTSDVTQSEYANEMEQRLGLFARYPTANKIAFEKIPWTATQKRIITKQWESVKGYPEVPGGYFSTRHIENAFRAVVFNSKEPMQTILDYVIYIDDEIKEKRTEFGLITKGE